MPPLHCVGGFCIQYSMKKYRRRGHGYRLLFSVLLFLASTLVLCAVFYLTSLDRATVSGTRQYYLLARVCEDTTASAVAGEVYHAGGAGYETAIEGKSVIVLAGYPDLHSATRVQNTLSEMGTETELFPVACAPFSLIGNQAKEAETISAHLRTLDSCINLLYDTANGLERGNLSQKEGKSALDGVRRALSGLQENSPSQRWKQALERYVRKSEELASGLVFSKDLRNLQVQLCLLNVRAKEYFM